MNRYRTIPGLGPSASKATTTTTCQKCLKKGHYSYECKASVQSRPYISRPSRSQQLQNPKLKPALAEQKMEEPNPASVPDEASVSLETRDVKSVEQPDTLEEAGRHFTSRKRRRSASSASSSSVDTISTNASKLEIEIAKAGKPKTRGHGIRSRSSSASESRSPPRSLDKHNSRDQGDGPDKDRSRPHTRLQPQRSDDSSDSEGYSRWSAGRHNSRHSRRDRAREGSRGLGRQEKRRRSRSADVLPNTRRKDGSPKITRQRSLSPYSRRLALTQAMNAGG